MTIYYSFIYNIYMSKLAISFSFPADVIYDVGVVKMLFFGSKNKRIKE